MQVNTVAWQTYGQTMVVVPKRIDEAKISVEAGLGTNFVLNMKVGSQVKPSSFIDKVLFCLEREETLSEQLIGYGICALVILYLLGSVIRAMYN